MQREDYNSYEAKAVEAHDTEPYTHTSRCGAMQMEGLQRGGCNIGSSEKDIHLKDGLFAPYSIYNVYNDMWT